MPAQSTSAPAPIGPLCHASSPTSGATSAERAPITRSLAALGAIAVVGALVSCGSAQPQPPTTTSAPPPASVPTTTAAKPPATAALPWPTYGAGNARLRAAAAPGVRPPFRRLWTFHGQHLLEFPPVVGYGSVFEEAFDGRLYSIDPANGRVRWRYTSHRCGWSSPALAGHLLFATFIGNAECHASRGGGELIAFSPETGHIHWRRAIGPSE